MTDQELLAQFEASTIKESCWDHRAHVKVGYLLIKQHGLVEAAARMSLGLRRFLAAHNIPTGPDMGYHETLTVTWLKLIATAMAEAGPFATADAFCDKQRHLSNKYALLFFYSREQIMSPEARAGLVRADLAPLPIPRDANAGCHLTPRKQEAREFAIAAHGDQRYGEQPYIVHLDAVAHILAPFGEEAVLLGYLHDVLEDTEVEQDELASVFGQDIARRVALLTDPSGLSRKERKRHSHRVLADIDPDGPDALALAAKAADRLANMRQCHADQNSGLMHMYGREFPAFQEAVKRFPTSPAEGTDDLDAQRARYQRLWLKPIWQELETFAD